MLDGYAGASRRKARERSVQFGGKKSLEGQLHVDVAVEGGATDSLLQGHLEGLLLGHLDRLSGGAGSIH